jgi:hypothetical protein
MLVAALVLPSVSAAQVPVTILLDQCVWRAGDNQAWATANLDERGWNPVHGVETQLPGTATLDSLPSAARVAR